MPTQLQIGNHRYTVTAGTIDNAGEFLYGRTLARSTLIEVDNTVSLSQRRDTLLHEVLHAIFADTPTGMLDEDEERITRHLTPGLLAVLRANPDLLMFLTGGE